jgi:hypothetical protein
MITAAALLRFVAWTINCLMVLYLFKETHRVWQLRGGRQNLQRDAARAAVDSGALI